ncbi:MAG: GNAT family N-acetyltransferase [Planctomycetota bacterium]|nr:GNAT family N-acetyltransferase [Planctomycetota bacterium]
MTPLATDRLRLRPFTPDDVEAFYAIWGDPEVIWWGASPSLDYTREKFLALLERHAEWQPGVGWYAVTPRDRDEVLGDVMLQPAKFVDGIEIGWHFRRSAWGWGYATEAARALLDYGFETVGLERIYAIVATQNAPSMRVVAKLEFEKLREMEYADLPHVLFARDRPPRT